MTRKNKDTKHVKNNAYKRVSTDREAIERKPRNLDGSRICRESIRQIESSEIFLNGSKSCRGSVESKAKRLDRNGCVEVSVKKLLSLKKRIFFKGGKTHKDECNKQAT